MKKIALVLLSVIFVLVTGSIHYISADDSTDSEDTSMGKSDVADQVFDNDFGEKEIVTVNDVKYEKVEFGQSFEGKHYADLWVGTGGLWLVQVCGGPNSEFLGVDCAYIFEIRTNQVVIEPDDVIYTNWNVLRAMN